MEELQQTLSSFAEQAREKGWVPNTGTDPARLNGTPVAFLMAEGGKLHRFEGTVQGGQRGRSAFSLVEMPGRKFNSNDIKMMVGPRPDDRWQA